MLVATLVMLGLGVFLQEFRVPFAILDLRFEGLRLGVCGKPRHLHDESGWVLPRGPKNDIPEYCGSYYCADDE